MKPDDSAPDSDQVKAGTAEFKTIKAGCGIRFDPETLEQDAGFDFSAAEQLKPSEPDNSHNPHDSSDT